LVSAVRRELKLTTFCCKHKYIREYTHPVRDKLDPQYTLKQATTMGQEASLPQDNGDDLEDQARAPPSSINPPVQGQGTARPGTKMIGTMIHRAAHSVGHKDFEGKEAARAAAASGQMPFTQYANGGTQQYPNLQHLTAEEQQQHLQQQQQQDSTNQHYHQEQQQEQIHHSQYPDHNPQHGSTPQIPAPNGSAYISSANVNGFYAAAVKGGRGKSLMKSMKNLSISNTIRSGVQATAHAAAVTATATANAVSATAAAVNANVIKSTKGGASEWETRWDEDDDDSEGEEDENDTMSAVAQGAVSPICGKVQQQSIISPGIDDGHSSLSLVTGMASASVTPIKSPQQRANVVTPVKNDVADDGLEWDTGAQQDVVSKPNVQMFLPLLRVLGKGSFGKVSAF
jgi:hypothetical protein